MPRLTEADDICALVTHGYGTTVGQDGRESRRALNGFANHSRSDVERDHDRAAIDQRAGRDARTATTLEHELTVPRLHRVVDLGGMIGPARRVLLRHRVERNHGPTVSRWTRGVPER